MTWMHELGDKIKEARQDAGLSQEALASKLSVGRVQLGNYEKGTSVIPVNIFAEIARALKVQSFTVAGYKVAVDENQPKPTLAPAQQLAFPFGREHLFGNASLRVDSGQSHGSIVVTAVFQKTRSA
jgi:transcriptional regulator with XRE-family HTH domain